MRVLGVNAVLHDQAAALVTAVPVLRALRRTYPHHERVLAAPARFAPWSGCSTVQSTR